MYVKGGCVIHDPLWSRKIVKRNKRAFFRVAMGRLQPGGIMIDVRTYELRFHGQQETWTPRGATMLPDDAEQVARAMLEAVAEARGLQAADQAQPGAER